MSIIQGGRSLFKQKKVHGIILTFLLGLTSCAPYQYVPGAYWVPNKRVEGFVVGTVGGGVIGAGSHIATTGAITGAVLGLGAGHVFGASSLANTLNCMGVAVVPIGQTIRIVIPADAIFDYETACIKRSGYPIMNNVSAFLKEFGRTPIKIAGYTDNIGSIWLNNEFSLARARSVLAYLWTHGIEFDHMYAFGMGEKYPISSNDNIIGSGANRRIEITLKIPCRSPDTSNCQAIRNCVDQCERERRECLTRFTRYRRAKGCATWRYCIPHV